MCGQCCAVCKDFDRAMVAAAFDDRRFRELNLKWTRHLRELHWPKAKSHKGNGAHQGEFAFTLTKSPSDDLTELDMIAAVRKLMAQKSCPVKYYAWYLEYGNPETKEHPHIHGLYETESRGRIESKHFKRAWKIWDEKVRMGMGFRGGYHRPVELEENYARYIAKQNGIGDAHLPTS